MPKVAVSGGGTVVKKGTGAAEASFPDFTGTLRVDGGSLLVPDAPDDAQPLLVPTVLPVTEAGERPWWRFVPDACRTGCHAVVTVPPGGETFRLDLLDARDEAMRVVDSRTFRTDA